MDHNFKRNNLNCYKYFLKQCWYLNNIWIQFERQDNHATLSNKNKGELTNKLINSLEQMFLWSINKIKII